MECSVVNNSLKNDTQVKKYEPRSFNHQYLISLKFWLEQVTNYFIVLERSSLVQFTFKIILKNDSSSLTQNSKSLNNNIK